MTVIIMIYLRNINIFYKIKIYLKSNLLKLKFSKEYNNHVKIKHHMKIVFRKKN